MGALFFNSKDFRPITTTLSPSGGEVEARSAVGLASSSVDLEMSRATASRWRLDDLP